MSFPADIKGCMKDCILSLFWPRKDIVGFFEKHGCTKAEIAPLQLEGEHALKRHEVVDALFSALAARSENGLGPFRAMLQSLLSWSHFDPYYFDKLRKLDRSTANKNLEHLRQLQGNSRRQDQGRSRAQSCTGCSSPATHGVARSTTRRIPRSPRRQDLTAAARVRAGTDLGRVVTPLSSGNHRGFPRKRRAGRWRSEVRRGTLSD